MATGKFEKARNIISSTDVKDKRDSVHMVYMERQLSENVELSEIKGKNTSSTKSDNL